jgi:hypothetical protein
MASIRVLVFAIAIATAAGIAGAQSPQTSQDTSAGQTKEKSFSITIGTPRTVFQAGSKVLVKATFKDISDHDIVIPNLPLDDLTSEFHMDIRDSQGNKARLRNPPPSPPYKQEDLPLHSTRGSFLGPGTSVDWDVDVTDLYILSDPGKYTIQAQYDDKSKSWVKSNTITITITP